MRFLTEMAAENNGDRKVNRMSFFPFWGLLPGSGRQFFGMDGTKETGMARTTTKGNSNGTRKGYVAG
jgi:hypothetical protein